MTPRAWIALTMLGALAAALAWWQLQREPALDAIVDTTPPTSVTTTPTSRGPAPATAISAAPETREPAPAPLREPAPATSASTQPQGLKGRLVDEAQQPLPGLAVHLAESASNDPFALDLLQPQRHAYTPLASTESASDGTFAIGLPVAQNKVYELYVVSPVHATTRLGGLRLLAGEWHDLGTLVMVPGATLRGRVTVAGRTDIPVPGALVTVEIGSAFADAALRGLPGANAGWTTTAEADGSYELRHVPSRGVVQVAATAPGFARASRSDIQLSRDAPVVVDFALAPGLTLGGSVVDASGRPVGNARIEAWPLKAAGAPLLGRSDSHGGFVVSGLVEGPYRVRVLARGFELWQQSDVPAGKADLSCQLTARSVVRVRATTPAGAVLRSYRLGLRRYFPEQPGRFGNVVDVPDQSVRLDGFTDQAELRDVPNGWFVCEVIADGYATTRSAPIDNTKEGGPLPREHTIAVTVQLGGGLRGVVTDEQGQPLAGATVQTQPDGSLPDNPLEQMLANTLPESVTRTQATTDAAGAFTLVRLSHGDYQLQVDHPEACRRFVRGLRVANDAPVAVAPIQLPRGAQVSGRVLRGTAPFGQAKVVLTSTETGGREALRLETATDANGAFVMPRRVPPGNYELRAAVVGTSEPEAQVFQQFLQLQRSSTTFSIAPGQALVQHDITLPTER